MGRPMGPPTAPGKPDPVTAGVRLILGGAGRDAARTSHIDRMRIELDAHPGVRFLDPGMQTLPPNDAKSEPLKGKH